MARTLKTLVATTVIGGLAWAAREYLNSRAQDGQAVILPAASPSVGQKGADKAALAGGLLDLASAWLTGPTETLSGALSGQTGQNTPAPTQTVTSGTRKRTGAANLSPILTLIRRYESGGNYNAIWTNVEPKDRPATPLVSMTIGQVLSWQDSIDNKYQSEASGAYQFMEDTLREYYTRAGLRASDRFNPANQDKLAEALLRRRGLSDYLEGRMTDVAFAQELSREWASLPAQTKDKSGRVATGQSYYAGDGLNTAHASQQAVLAAVRKI